MLAKAKDAKAKDATFARSLTKATFAFDYATFAFGYATQRQKAKAKGEAKGAHFFFATFAFGYCCC